jgi:predicted membrane-bound dolichyl-phosphate-mannose-protein mannosyltransferase
MQKLPPIYFLVTSLLTYLVLNLIFGSQALLSRFDAESVSKLYYEAIEALEKGIFLVKPGISDATLYAYAGWRYMQGVSPDQILFEHPPLGKYLIGLSIAVFGNQNMLGFILGACTLILLYLTAAELGGRGVITLAPVLLALDRLFITFSHISFLDIYMLFFLTLSTYLFTKALKQTKLLIPFSIAYGLAVACKWTAAFLILPLALTLVIKRRWRTLTYLAATIPLSLAAYTPDPY